MVNYGGGNAVRLVAPSGDTSGARDATAIKAAIAGLPTAGGLVGLEAGTFYLNATITMASGVTVAGDGPGATTLTPVSDYGDVFTIPVAANGATIRDLSVTYTGKSDTSVSTASTHAAVKFTIVTSSNQLVQHVVIQDVRITGMGQGIFAPWTQGSSLNFAQYYYLSLERLRIWSCNIALLLTGFSDSRICDIDAQNIFGQNASLLQGHVAPVSATAAVSATYSSACQNLINDLGNSVVEKVEVYGGVGDGIVFQDCVTSHVWGCETGSLTGHGVTILGCNTNFEVIGLHSALNTLSGCQITTDAVNTQELTFTACRFENNTQRGMYMVPAGGTSIGRIRLLGCDVQGNSLGSAGTYDGVVFQGQDLQVVGGSYADFQGVPTQRYGINANQSGADYVSVIGSVFSGNVTGTIIASGTHILVTGSHGVNGTGFGTFNPAVPNTGSGNAVGNGNPYPVSIYLTGQVGTHVIDESSTDQLLPSDPPVVVLQPNEKIYFSTTKATSWKWYGQ